MPAGADPVPSNRRIKLGSLLASVRVRIALAAFAVVAVTMAAGGTALVWDLHRSLVGNLVSTASAEASDIAAIMAQPVLPDHLPQPRQGYAAQVVDPSGRVIATTADLTDRHPLARVHPRRGTSSVFSTPGSLLDADDPLLTVAMGVSGPRGPLTIYVVASTEPVENSGHVLTLALALALPLLSLLAGFLAWMLAGRALRPVEAVRVEVSEISGSDLQRRVVVPPVDDEVGRLVRTMNEMLSRIEAGDDRRKQFVSDASHELRSPLAALLAQVEVARAHPDLADWPAVAEAVLEDGTRLWKIVDDLLLLARSDEGHLRAGHESVDLDELVLAEGRRLAEHGRVSIDLSAVGAARVIGDPDQFSRVVRNLLENAERHATHLVGVELRSHGAWVELTVADDGPGIPVDQRAQVFERFVRLDEARNRPSGGTGLGLAIVGEVVAVHGGTVTVADSVGGARFVVRLPKAGYDGPAAPASAPARGTTAPVTPPLSQVR
jgi:signal transduction histidine kinase